MVGKQNGRGKPQGCGTNKTYNKTKKVTQNQEPNKKEMLFVPKNAGKMQGHTYETIKEYILNELQKDLEHGEDLASNLRKGKDTGIEMKEPTRTVAPRQELIEDKKKSDNVDFIRMEYVEEQ